MRRPQLGEHVKVLGDPTVYEIVCVNRRSKLVALETAHMIGDHLDNEDWKVLQFLDSAVLTPALLLVNLKALQALTAEGPYGSTPVSTLQRIALA
jgi:hypothetical protein